MSAILYLDTRFSTFSSNLDHNPSASNWILAQNLINISPNFQIGLSECSIPILQPAIQANINNSIFWQENGSTISTYQATIPESYYDGSSFASTLQNAMNSQGAFNSYNVSYNINTKLISIFTTIPQTFRLLAASTMLANLGYATNVTTPFQVTHTGQGPISLSGTRYVDILASFGTNSISYDSKSNKIARIYINQSYGSIQTYVNQNVSLMMAPVSADSLQTIRLDLYDDRGLLYKLPQNGYISTTFILKAVF